jgi:hypothetical protein
MTNPAGIPAELCDALARSYTLERELGRRGIATVYLAHDVRHERPVRTSPIASMIRSINTPTLDEFCLKEGRSRSSRSLKLRRRAA